MLEEEPPGPFILLYETNNIEESISLHNKCGYRRMTSVFTDINRKGLADIIQQIDAGAVFINQAPQETSAPIIGGGKSCNGVQTGLGLLSHLTRKKVVFAPKSAE